MSRRSESDMVKYDYQTNSYRWSPLLNIANNAGASMIQTHFGTAWLYVRVGWWYPTAGWVAYWPRIVIEEPKGVPNFCPRAR